MAAEQTTLRGSFGRGLVRDTARHAIPPGGVYNSTDFLLERPGMAYKRGGWERHSAALGLSASAAAVATIHIPTRIVAVGDDGKLYEVTGQSGPQADVITTGFFSPGENPPFYVDRLIFCDPAASAVPKTVFWNGTALATGTLFSGAAPAAAHSTVHESFVVLARSAVADGHLNRVWIPPDPTLEPGVEQDEDWFDSTYEVTGLASYGGVLLIFSPKAVERVLGSIPPGRPGEDMRLQPLHNVGCLDARSIVHTSGGVIFAGQDGVYLTNGSAPRSLTSRPDGTGIQSYWRSLFAPGEIRQLIGGLIGDDFYILSVLDSVNAEVVTLLLHLPSGAWMPVSNMAARMFAQGRDESENLELYMASASEGYVEKVGSILRPDQTHSADGDGTPVEPLLELPFGDAAALKMFGQGRLSYTLAGTGSPTLAVSTAPGLNPTSFTSRKTLATSAGSRSPFDILEDNQQTVTVRVQQTGGSATTEIHGLEADVRVYAPQVTGGE